MYTLVLLRHGESTWNKENKFTGWFDCDLSEQGVLEATKSGHILNELGYDGWIVVEQDVLPGMGSPKDSAQRNRDYLESIGFEKPAA